jgi:4-hydroxy-4-methyl-2-oxoglutarate aldolase
MSPLPPSQFHAFDGLYAEQSVATVHEAAGRAGALSSVVKPIWQGMRLSGPAFPVSLTPRDNLALHEAIYQAPAGSVLVVNAYDYLEAGPFGEIMAVAAMTRGLRGLVTSGSVRDREAIGALGFAVFSKGISVKGTEKHVTAQFPLTVCIDGVSISPGDWVLGDADGVVIIPANRAGEVLERAVERERKERDILARIRAGERTLDIYHLVGSGAPR